MSYKGYEGNYYFSLANFADLVKNYGVEKVIEDLQKYQEEACNLLRGFFQNE